MVMEMAVYINLKDFFLGMEVEYTGSSEGLPPGKIVIRCILLLWTGDYPAQAQVGKFIQGGIRPCRRCNVVGMNTIFQS